MKDCDYCTKTYYVETTGVSKYPTVTKIEQVFCPMCGRRVKEVHHG